MKTTLSRVLAISLLALPLPVIQTGAQSIYEPYTFTTLAGDPGYGSADGTGSAARFYAPWGVAADSTGNVYVADHGNHTIRKVTQEGVVTTLAGLAGSDGSADGTGSDARFAGPSGVAVDSTGNVYVADSGNSTIRKVTPSGVVTTLAGLAGRDGNGLLGGNVDGRGSDAIFSYPSGVAVDSVGNVYVADSGNRAIRKVTPSGVVTTLAGSEALFSSPNGVAVDSAGNVYVADSGNNTIQKVTSSGVVTTLAGLVQVDADGNPVGGSVDGTGSAARFTYPSGVAVDGAGNVYVADQYNSTIRKVTPSGAVTTLAGFAGSFGVRDGTGSDARFYYPSGVAVDSAGNVYVAETGNSTIRKVTPSGAVTTLAGRASIGSDDGMGSVARFWFPRAVAVDSAGSVYVADSENHTIRKVTPEGVVTTLAGLAGTDGSADGTGSDARFNYPEGVAVDSAGNVYVADGTIRKVTPAGVVTTLAGLAGGSVAVDSAGNLFGTGNETIWKVTPAGVVTTPAGLAGIAGSADGTGSEARFWHPSGVAVDRADNVYVADSANSTIRKVTPTGEVTTLAGLAGNRGSADGTGSAARFGGDEFGHGPSGVAVDSAGSVYVADYSNNTIRKVTPAGVVTTLAGGAGYYGRAVGTGSTDGTGIDARFNGPSGVAVDGAGNVYVADYGNNTIRKGYPTPKIRSAGPALGFNGGQFGFTLTGPTGRLVVVEASTDLVSWLSIWTNTFAGTLNFSDPQSGVYSNRFYRAHTP